MLWVWGGESWSGSRRARRHGHGENSARLIAPFEQGAACLNVCQKTLMNFGGFAHQGAVEGFTTKLFLLMTWNPPNTELHLVHDTFLLSHFLFPLSWDDVKLWSQSTRSLFTWPGPGTSPTKNKLSAAWMLICDNRPVVVGSSLYSQALGEAKKRL